jgi:hypothetical protein
VILCSANLEAYLEDLLADWSRQIRAQGVTTEKLPRRVRAFLLASPPLTAAFRKFIAEDDETNLVSRIEALIGQAHYDLAVDGRQLPMFPPGLLYADRKYPSPKNLRRLFSRFGVTNVFNELNRIARRDAEGLLTSFNDLRTEMAHAGMPIGLSDGDIKQHLKNVQLVVGCIDRMFYSHVNRTVGGVCWTT